MKIVFHAENTIEAAIIKGMLENEGILAFINGYYLQGGIGELPVNGVVTISVINDDYESAQNSLMSYTDSDSKKHENDAATELIDHIPACQTC